MAGKKTKHYHNALFNQVIPILVNRRQTKTPENRQLYNENNHWETQEWIS